MMLYMRNEAISVLVEWLDWLALALGCLNGEGHTGTWVEAFRRAQIKRMIAVGFLGEALK